MKRNENRLEPVGHLDVDAVHEYDRIVGVQMDKESYQRVIPRIREDATLFPVGSASKGD